MLDNRVFRGGTALYTFSPSTKQWTIVALDACKGGSSFTPIIDGEEIHSDSVVEIQGNKVHTRNRWYDRTANSYIWEQWGSLDGKHWLKAFDAKFTKRNDTIHEF